MIWQSHIHLIPDQRAGKNTWVCHAAIKTISLANAYARCVNSSNVVNRKFFEFVIGGKTKVEHVTWLAIESQPAGRPVPTDSHLDFT